MFKVEGAVKMGLTSTACTSEACLWNNFYTENIKAEKISNIFFYSDEAKTKVRTKPKQLPDTASDLDKKSFLDMLSKCNPNAIVLSTYKDYYTPFNWKTSSNSANNIDMSFPKPLKNILTAIDLSDASSWNIENLASMIRSVINDSKIRNVESSTMDQSSNPLWYSQRAGRITASKAHSVLHTNIAKPSKSLLATICDPIVHSSLNIPALKWGKDKETDAVAAFVDFFVKDTNTEVSPNIMVWGISKVTHDKPSVKGAGFRICRKFPWIGASPDGHVNCECCGMGILEIKCPFNYADVGLNDSFFNEKSRHLDIDGSVKKEHPYYAQVQLQMYVCKVNICYFVTWTPINYCVSKVQYSEQFTHDMVERINSFWITCVLPKIISLKSDGCVSAHAQSISKNNIYCKCQKEKDEDMVGCDNNDCKLKWFHFSCVGLKTKPRRKVWFCSKACERISNHSNV